MDRCRSGHGRLRKFGNHIAFLIGFDQGETLTNFPSREQYHRGEQEAGQAVWGHYSVLIHSVYPRSDIVQGHKSSQMDGFFSIPGSAIHSQCALHHFAILQFNRLLRHRPKIVGALVKGMVPSAVHNLSCLNIATVIRHISIPEMHELVPDHSSRAKRKEGDCWK